MRRGAWVSTLHAQRLMMMWDAHRGEILNWSSGVGMHMYVEVSWWAGLGWAVSLVPVELLGWVPLLRA